MEMAEVGGDEIGYVNAHGTGTPLNDVAETHAYETAFRGRGRPVPVSSTKSYFGHCLGAAGALEAAITIMAIRCGALLPTLRLTDPIESPGVNWLRGEVRREAAAAGHVGFGWVWWQQHGAHIREQPVRERPLMTANLAAITGIGSVSPYGPLAGLIPPGAVEPEPITAWTTAGLRRAFLVKPFRPARCGAGPEDQASGSPVGVGAGGFFAGHSGCRDRSEPGGPVARCRGVRHWLRMR